MKYESNRPSGSSGGLIVGLLVLLLLGGIGILGLGTYVWFRTNSARQQAVVREQAAMAAQTAAAARQAGLELEQQAPESPAPPLPSGDLVDIATIDGAKIDASVTIDSEGNIALHGRAVTSDELVTTLRGLAAQGDGNVAVTIWADEACEFADVAGVVRAARTAGVTSLKIVVPPSRDAERPLEQD